MSKKDGYIYVMDNKSMPGLLKIGYSGHVNIRAKQLRTTGVPEHFNILYHVYVEDRDKIEKAIHKALNHFRNRDDREFFKIDLDTAILTIHNVITTIITERLVTELSLAREQVEELRHELLKRDFEVQQTKEEFIKENKPVKITGVLEPDEDRSNIDYSIYKQPEQSSFFTEQRLKQFKTNSEKVQLLIDKIRKE